MSDKKLISLVIPAYREEKNIPLLYQELQDTLSPLNQSYEFEIIIVNDGSPDATWFEIEKLCIADTRVKGIHLSRNFGHQAALTAGLERANGDAIISMDADMQDPISVAVEMISEWERGYEVVYARRKNRNDNFLKKHTALWYYKILGHISDTQIPRNVGDFRLVDKKVLRAFLKLKEKDRYVRGMFAWLGFKTTFVDFDRPERIHGDTGYTWKKMMKLASDGILNFSTFPLKIGAFIGVFMILASCIFLTYMITGTILQGNLTYFQLYKWISVAGFGFMGLQFIFMWILGEYIGRIYNETRERPLYIVSETKNIQ